IAGALTVRLRMHNRRTQDQPNDRGNQTEPRHVCAEREGTVAEGVTPETESIETELIETNLIETNLISHVLAP
ncbi:MAG: hypothetical protein WBD59_19670, partial [Candidatus Sulfotelmatobacter sp.]